MTDYEATGGNFVLEEFLAMRVRTRRAVQVIADQIGAEGR
jgi:hypothetical protein